jgi:hypothetical protein
VRFEAREVPTYAEPVAAADLKVGSAYFAVTFVDEEMLIPVVRTFVFVGRNLEPNDAGKAYFQDIFSYRAGERYDQDSENGSAEFLVCSEINNIFEFERALDRLLACSLRRARA